MQEINYQENNWIEYLPVVEFSYTILFMLQLNKRHFIPTMDITRSLIC